jgi:NADH-quinone oxidoreductase E subunit
MTDSNNVLTPALKGEAERIAARYEQKRAALLPVLHLIQTSCGHISQEAEREVAELFGIPIVDVREVMTFYTLFRSKPCARLHFQVCRTLTCSLLGGDEILRYLKEKLGLEEGGRTSDGQFHLETVECLGACEIAPMMTVNGEYVGPLTKEKIDQIVERSG